MSPRANQGIRYNSSMHRVRGGHFEINPACTLRILLLAIGCASATGCGHAFTIAEFSQLSAREIHAVQGVQVFSEEQLKAYDYEVLGPVQGASIKYKFWDPAPTSDQALEQAKYWAWTKGANGIVNVAIRNAGLDYGTNTWASVTCSAIAVKIAEPGRSTDRDELAGRPVRIALLCTRLDDVDIPHVVAAVVQSVVGIRTQRTLATGFLISRDGYLITAAHVVGKRSSVDVEFFDGSKTTAVVLRTDTVSDAALLKAEGVDFAPIALEWEEYPNAGEDVLVIGSPLSDALTHSVSRGIVSGIREGQDVTLIQTDAAVNPGNSGGPLVNSHGQAIGMVSWKIVGTKVEGLGFAVPIRDVLLALKVEPTATTE